MNKLTVHEAFPVATFHGRFLHSMQGHVHKCRKLHELQLAANFQSLG